MKQDAEFIKKIWHLLIAQGAVCKNQNWSDNPDPIEFYSGCFNADRQATAEALDHIIHCGIDYDNCSDIKDGTDAAFTDTFNDSVEVPYLMGILATNNGKRYHWGTKSSEVDLPVIMEFLSSNITLEEAITSLRSRLDEHKDGFEGYYEFNCSCELKNK